MAYFPTYFAFLLIVFLQRVLQGLRCHLIDLKEKELAKEVLKLLREANVLIHDLMGKEAQPHPAD